MLSIKDDFFRFRVHRTVSKNGNPYTTAKVRASEGGEALFVNVITFSESAGRELLAQADGDELPEGFA